MEEITVVVAVNPETADRIQKELIRQNFVKEVDDLFHRMSEAGFKPEIVGEPDPDKTMFSDKIQIPACYFVNRQINGYNMQVIY